MSIPSFSTLLHGDLGQCVLHCLHLHELAVLSQVAHSTLALVQRKWAAFKELDLTLYPLMPQRTLQMIAASVLGVETLRLDVAESFVLQHSNSSAHEPSVEMLVDSQQQPTWYVYMRWAQTILSIVDRNASTLSVLHVRLGGPMPRATWSALSSGFTQILLHPLLGRAATLPKLQVLQLPTPLAFLPDHSLLPLCTQPSAAPTPRSDLSLVAQALHAAPSPFGDMRVLSGMMYSTRYLHRPLPPWSSKLQSLRLCFPWHRAHGSEEAERCMGELVRAVPAHPLDQLFDEEKAESEGRDPRYSLDRLRLALTSFSSSLLYLSMQLYQSYTTSSGVLRLHLPSLLQLTMECDVDTNLADVQLDCPRLLSLHLHLELVGDEHDRPSRAERAASRAAQAQAQADGEQMAEEQDHEDSGDDDDDDDDDEEGEQPQRRRRPVWMLPPSLFSCLSRSPRLRFLCLPLCGPTVPRAIPNYASLSLDGSTRSAMEGRARELGAPSPFDTSRPEHRLRVLLYGIAMLPLAQTLLLFEDCSPLVPMSEFLSLFPSLKSYSTEPDYDTTHENLPAWFRPPAHRYGLRLEHWNVKLMHTRSSARWDRLSSAAGLEHDEDIGAYLESAADETAGYLNLAHKAARLSMPLLAPVLHAGRFRDLSVLYLSAPTQVSVDAVRALISHCTQLYSLSLIQLLGVDDSVFFFPDDEAAAAAASSSSTSSTPLIRSSLRILKLKNACLGLRKRRGMSGLTVLALVRAASLFPHIHTLDLANFTSPSSLIRTLNHILEGPPPPPSPAATAAAASASSTSPASASRWRGLRTIMMPIQRGDAASNQAFLQLHHLFAARAEAAAALPTSTTGEAWTLGSVVSRESSAEGMMDDGQWMMHERVTQSRVWRVLPGPARIRFGRVTCEEAPCYADYCEHEEAEAPVAGQQEQAAQAAAPQPEDDEEQQSDEDDEAMEEQ